MRLHRFELVKARGRVDGEGRFVSILHEELSGQQNELTTNNMGVEQHEYNHNSVADILAEICVFHK